MAEQIVRTRFGAGLGRVAGVVHAAVAAFVAAAFAPAFASAQAAPAARAAAAATAPAPAAKATAAPASAAPAADAAVRRPGSEVRVFEDESVRIEETRLRGRVQRITVVPKGAGGAAAAPAYEINVGAGGRDPSQDRSAAGQRVWSVLRF